jgi:hypothetical protein
MRPRAAAHLPHRRWGSPAEGREGAARERENRFDAVSALARDPSVAFGATSPSAMGRMNESPPAQGR